MIEPRGYHVLVKPEKIEDSDPKLRKMKEIGLVRADHEDALREQAGIDRGVVVAIGPTAYSNELAEGRPAWCSVGESVIFAKYAGKAVHDPADGGQYIVLKDDDIICAVKG
jgi:co-chaperonin GroES (HSP10)